MNTKALRQKILDLAIHGKLVPQDPNDEPASVLLERIRDAKERLIKAGKIKCPKKTKATFDKPHYENEAFNIPKSWIMAQMSDLFLLNPKSEIDDNTEIGFIPMACVDDGFSGKHSFEIRNWGDVKKGYCHFQDGDIGVAKISPCFENLKSCILQSLPNGVGTGTTELVILRSLGVYAPFYLYLFKSSWYISQGTKYFKGVVGQQRVNKAIFTELEVPLPSVAEQERIVAEIKRWFGLIDLIEKDKFNLANNIKLAKSKILDLAIHGKLVPQDPTDEPASELLKRINPKAEITCDNGHYQKLPEGWAVCTLKNICKVITGSTPSKSNPIYYGGNIPFYKPADLDFGRYVKNASEYLSEEGMCVSRVVPAGSTAVCCIGTIGKVGYLVNAGTTNQQINCAIPSKAVYDVFLFYLCSSSWFYNNLISKSSAVTISIVNKSKMENIEVPLPPLEEQHRIVAKIEEIFAQLDAIEASL